MDAVISVSLTISGKLSDHGELAGAFSSGSLSAQLSAPVALSGQFSRRMSKSGLITSDGDFLIDSGEQLLEALCHAPIEGEISTIQILRR